MRRQKILSLCRRQDGFTFLSISRKEGGKSQSLMKKSMLRLTVTATGEEFFELNKAEPGAAALH